MTATSDGREVMTIATLVIKEVFAKLITRTDDNSLSCHRMNIWILEVWPISEQSTKEWVVNESLQLFSICFDAWRMTYIYVNINRFTLSVFLRKTTFSVSFASYLGFGYLIYRTSSINFFQFLSCCFTSFLYQIYFLSLTISFSFLLFLLWLLRKAEYHGCDLKQ